MSATAVTAVSKNPALAVFSHSVFTSDPMLASLGNQINSAMSQIPEATQKEILAKVEAAVAPRLEQLNAASASGIAEKNAQMRIQTATQFFKQAENIALLREQDLAMVHARFGKISPDDLRMLNDYWTLVATDPHGYENHEALEAEMHQLCGQAIMSASSLKPKLTDSFKESEEWAAHAKRLKRRINKEGDRIHQMLLQRKQGASDQEKTRTDYLLLLGACKGRTIINNALRTLIGKIGDNYQTGMVYARESFRKSYEKIVAEKEASLKNNPFETSIAKLEKQIAEIQAQIAQSKQTSTATASQGITLVSPLFDLERTERTLKRLERSLESDRRHSKTFIESETEFLEDTRSKLADMENYAYRMFGGHPKAIFAQIPVQTHYDETMHHLFLTRKPAKSLLQMGLYAREGIAAMRCVSMVPASPVLYDANTRKQLKAMNPKPIEIFIKPSILPAAK